MAEPLVCTVCWQPLENAEGVPDDGYRGDLVAVISSDGEMHPRCAQKTHPASESAAAMKQ